MLSHSRQLSLNQHESPSNALRLFGDYLHGMVDMPPRAWQDLKNISAVRRYSRRHFLVREGETFGQEVFILEGILRAFTLDEEGFERTTAFYQPHQFMGISTLRNQAGLSAATYQSLTDSILVYVNSDGLRSLLDTRPALVELAAFVKQQEIERLKKRDSCLMQPSGLEKYKKFRVQYPKLEDEIPHYTIASYLGITPVSLSRARKKMGIRPSH